MQENLGLKEAIVEAQNWVQNPYFDISDRQELKDLLESKNEHEILERFYRDLEFGTGGLRSIVGMGRNRMNKYNVRKATHALCLSLKHFFPNENNSPLKVAISYDSRHFSFEFAKEVAGVLSGHGIHSYIFKRLNPTPLLSYSVRYHQAQAGIMITASHNPSNYNGYKVYWSDGAQIISPQDQDIITRYNNIINFNEIPRIDFAQAEQKGLIHWVDSDVEKDFENQILKNTLNRKICSEKGEKLKIVYTPLHGTGLIPNTEILSNLGFKNLFVVKEQSTYDGDFPTVKSPNPENPEALKMAVDLMMKEKAHVVFGTDPDSDRLGVVVNHKGQPYYLNGNQLAEILLYYVLSQRKEKNLLPANPYIIKTIVTSPLQDKIAQHFSVRVINTLTGFKWICSKIRTFEKEHPEWNFVFSSEESFGILCHTFARDKDAISAVALTAEVALFCLLQEKTLVDYLDEISEKFGLHYESLLSINYEGIEGAEKINRIMKWFRETKDDNLFGKKILAIEDYQTSLIKNLEKKTEEKISIPKSNVLGFILAGGDRLFLRPSGTEPKIKFYTMVSEDKGDLNEKKKNAKKTCQEIESQISKICKEI